MNKTIYFDMFFNMILNWGFYLAAEVRFVYILSSRSCLCICMGCTRFVWFGIVVRGI